MTIKKYIHILLSGLLLAPLVSTTVVFAQDTLSVTDTNETTQSTQDDGTDSEDQNFETRKQDYKKQFKTNLATWEQTRLKTRCKNAQGKLSSLKGRINGIATSRTEIHTNILTHLNDLVTKLKAKGVDTTTLEADVAVLKTKIETFNTDLTAYQLAVADLVKIDCTEDPDTFKSALLAARDALDKVKADAKDVRTYLKDTIKPLLVQIHKDLEKEEGGDTDSDDTNETTEEGGQ